MPRKKSGRAPRTVKTGATKQRSAAEPVLLAGGIPQIAKADGDTPVQAYLAAVADRKSEISRRFDALVERHVPDVRKDVPWIDIHEDDIEERRVAKWIRQVAALPGWGKD